MSLVCQSISAFTVTNQTGHNVYLISKSNKYAVRSVYGKESSEKMYSRQLNKAILKNGASKNITISAQLGPNDMIHISAFYTDAAGICYINNVSYNPSFLANVLILKTGPIAKKEHMPATVSVMDLDPEAHGNGLCGGAYQNVIVLTAVSMPANMP